MLRHRKSLPFLLIAVLLVSGTVFSQRKGGEVTVSRCWQFPAENVIDLASNGRDIFAAGEGGRVFALSAKGEKLWETDLGGDISSDVGIEKGFVVVTTRSAANAIAINRLSQATGLPATASADPDPPTEKIQNSAASAKVGDVVILGDDAGLVTSLSGSGSVWKFKTGGGISAVIPDGDVFIVISRDDFIYSLYAKNGALQWKRRMPGRIGHYALGKGFLFVSALDQHGASFIDLVTGRVAGQIVLDGDQQVLTDPVVIDDNFIVAAVSGISGYSLSGCGQKETASEP
jgi:outer membrane protein assembly factor BamB